VTVHASLNQSQDTSTELLQKLWWWYRWHFLQAQLRPAERDALLQPIEPDALAVFERVLQSRIAGARMEHANTTHAEVVQRLVAEADHGYVPLDGEPDGFTKLDNVPQMNPFDAQTVTRFAPLVAALRAHPYLWAVGLMGVGLCVSGVLLYSVFTSVFGTPAETVGRPPTSVASAMPSASAAPSQRVAQQRTAPLLPGQVAPRSPTSLDVEGTVYTVFATSVKDRQWEVIKDDSDVASWLAGTQANLVFYVPTLADVKEGTEIHVRDTRGLVRTFVADEPRTVKPHQTEVLAQHHVGVTLVGPGTTAQSRHVVSASLQPRGDSYEPGN
jgi:hypothetical protein